MTPTRQGSFRLFRFAGIEVFLHWSWFVVAAYEITNRKADYSSLTWNALEYVALFAIVLLHEFGHALACRSVGGQANQIVLWPLGGVAYVAPPPRPGPTLWSIAAGPIVNVALLPVLSLVTLGSRSLGWAASMPDLHALIRTIWIINFALLVFNMVPIYPLDGGQIFRALLWYAIGRARSLMVATSIGFVAAAALIVGALVAHSVWFTVLAVFMLLNCWGGLLHARTLARAAQAPRRDGFACPGCHAAPPQGAFWTCGKCHRRFDTFETHAACPPCGTQFAITACPDCGRLHPISEWIVPPPLPANA